MMKNAPMLAAALVAVLAFSTYCATADAQFKAKPKSKDALGSGLYVPPAEALPAAPASSAPAVAPADDKRSVKEVVEDIARCMMETIPQDWTSAQIEVVELGHEGKERQFEANHTYIGADGKVTPFTPCNPRQTATDMYNLNRALDPAKRNWIKATLVLTKEGKFDLKYDYARKDTGAAPAQAPTAPPAEKAN